MKILLADNNDSFTYNVVDLLRKLPQIEFDIIKTSSLREDDLNDYQAFIISPGPGVPEDFPFLNRLISYCDLHNKPLLGICLGHQAIAKYFGAKLINLNNVVHGQSKSIELQSKSNLYKDLESSFNVGLYHSWIVEISSLNDEIPLKITAMSEDDILMSFEHETKSIYGIQFHPESFLTKVGQDILNNFLDICDA